MWHSSSGAEGHQCVSSHPCSWEVLWSLEGKGLTGGPGAIHHHGEAQRACEETWGYTGRQALGASLDPPRSDSKLRSSRAQRTCSPRGRTSGWGQWAPLLTEEEEGLGGWPGLSSHAPGCCTWSRVSAGGPGSPRREPSGLCGRLGVPEEDSKGLGSCSMRPRLRSGDMTAVRASVEGEE